MIKQCLLKPAAFFIKHFELLLRSCLRSLWRHLALRDYLTQVKISQQCSNNLLISSAQKNRANLFSKQKTVVKKSIRSLRINHFKLANDVINKFNTHTQRINNLLCLISFNYSYYLATDRREFRLEKSANLEAFPILLIIKI